MTPVLIGVIGLIAFLVLMFLGMPVPTSMALVGFIGFAIIRSPNAALQMVTAEITGNFSKYTLSVAPMFALMGYIAYHSGLGARLFNACQKCLGHYRGGMAMATAVACAFFGAICGSGPATIGTMSAVAYPEMKKAGYHPKISCCTIAVGASISVLIPPSLTFVIYGNASETSIGRLFLSGIIPGVLLTVLCIAAIAWTGWREPSAAPKTERSSAAERWSSIKNAGLIEIAIVFLLSIGGLFAGWFTATEAGAIGSSGIIIICIIRRQLTWIQFMNSLLDTAKLTAMVFVLLASAAIFSRFIAITTISVALANMIKGLEVSGLVVLVIVLVFYTFMGMITDVMSIVLLTIPVLFPILIGVYGYDTVWFGNLVLLMLCVGGLTPPVGISIFITKGCIKDPDVTLAQIFSGVLPFLAATFIVIILLIIFPQLALWLPNLVYGA
jgi:tripartite ATP-independent transporter DctM subunit